MTTPDAPLPADLSQLSEEEFLALCPQGEHAPGAEPLSPAAQFVLAACDDAVNKLPLSAPPESFSICLIATAIRAAAYQVVPNDELAAPVWTELEEVRAALLEIASELEAQP